jgi:hypothetical protein
MQLMLIGIGELPFSTKITIPSLGVSDGMLAISSCAVHHFAGGFE